MDKEIIKKLMEIMNSKIDVDEKLKRLYGIFKNKYSLCMALMAIKRDNSDDALKYNFLIYCVDTLTNEFMIFHNIDIQYYNIVYSSIIYERFQTLKNYYNTKKETFDDDDLKLSYNKMIEVDEIVRMGIEICAYEIADFLIKGKYYVTIPNESENRDTYTDNTIFQFASLLIKKYMEMYKLNRNNKDFAGNFIGALGLNSFPEVSGKKYHSTNHGGTFAKGLRLGYQIDVIDENFSNTINTVLKKVGIIPQKFPKKIEQKAFYVKDKKLGYYLLPTEEFIPILTLDVDTVNDFENDFILKNIQFAKQK